MAHKLKTHDLVHFQVGSVVFVLIPSSQPQKIWLLFLLEDKVSAVSYSGCKQISTQQGKAGLKNDGDSKVFLYILPPEVLKRENGQVVGSNIVFFTNWSIINLAH